MNAPQGIIEFGNIRNIMYGGMTYSQGISPSTAVLYAVPQPLPYLRRAPLRFRYGGTVITLQDCILDSVDFQLGDDGHTRMVLAILDRRWKWRKFGWINGEYNTVEGDGEIRLSRFRTPQQLASLCFEAMGERGYDVSQLPNDGFPEVIWSGIPAEMLAQLCEQLGCRVTLNPINNRAQIVRVGVGRQLPAGFDVLSDDLSLDAPEFPDSIVFQCGPTLRQISMRLEPVGEDTDGSIKHIDQLSYKPKGGWTNSLPPQLPDVAPQHRDLASKCLYKWWRPEVPATWWGERIEELERILPFSDKLPQTAPVDVREQNTSRFQVRSRKPAIVFGDFHDFEEEDKEGEKILDTPVGKKQVYEESYQIDGARGLLMLSRPAVLLKGSPAEEKKDEKTGKIVACDFSRELCERLAYPAKLWLTTGVGFRDKQTHAFDRYQIRVVPPGAKLGTQPYYVTREDVFLRVWSVFRRDKSGDLKRRTVTNVREVERLAKFYIDQAIRQFQMKTPGSRTYAGFKPIPPDGAIQQISWQLAQDGHARTMASRNTELLNVGVSFGERRFYEKVRGMFAAQAKGKKRRPEDKDDA